MKTLLSALVGATLAWGAVEAVADGTAGDRQVALVIESKSLAEALDDWARQTGYQIFLQNWDLAKQLTAPAVKGTFTAQAALQYLLADTPLTFKWLPDRRAVAIHERGSRDQRTRKADARALHLAQAPEAASAAGERGVQAESTGGSRPLQRTANGEVIDEVLVTGSYITGQKPIGGPVTVYTRGDIERSGAATVAQFSRVMPQNFSSVDASIGASVGASGFDQSGNNGNYGAGFNLRGLGPGATLTLLNGHRLAPAGAEGAFVDISLIPLSAVDRIEVLSDSASAIYGADAIGGVVNIILRDEFEGAETALRYGAATDDGAEEFTGSQLAGHAWDSGNFIFVFDHHSQNGLRANQRDFVPNLGEATLLLPEQTRNSVFLAARQELSNTTSLAGDFFYSEREFEQTLTPLGIAAPDFIMRSSGTSKNVRASLDLSQEFANTWRADVFGVYSKLDQPSVATFPSFVVAGAMTLQPVFANSETRELDVRANGSLFSLGGRTIKAAFGAEMRRERLHTFAATVDAGVTGFSSEDRLSREVVSAYAELSLPLVDASNARAALKRLELSLAGRYDHYDDFGDTTNPKVGLRWSPVDGLDLRASYGRSFRAPGLTQIRNQRSYFVANLADPQAPDFRTRTLINNSPGNPELDPERSESYTVGLDIRPAALPAFSLGLTYFDINFTDRVSTPPLVGGTPFLLYTLPQNRQILAPLIQQPADPAFVAAAYASGAVRDGTGGGPAAIEAYFDNSLRNLSATRESGLELVLGYGWTTGIGQFDASLLANYLLNQDYQAISTMPFRPLNNQFGQPVDTKVHASLSWSKGALGSTLTLNYWGHYENTLLTPSQPIDSWTTADLQLTYVTPSLSIALSLLNVTDEDPPAVAVPAGFVGYGYDPANASPLGRMIALSASKRWGGRR